VRGPDGPGVRSMGAPAGRRWCALWVSIDRRCDNPRAFTPNRRGRYSLLRHGVDARHLTCRGPRGRPEQSPPMRMVDARGQHSDRDVRAVTGRRGRHHAPRVPCAASMAVVAKARSSTMTGTGAGRGGSSVPRGSARGSVGGHSGGRQTGASRARRRVLLPRSTNPATPTCC
jgi:hypothetical protein